MITLLVLTDGRAACLHRTIASAEDQLIGDIAQRAIYDDSADGAFHADLRARYGESFELIRHPGGRQGFGGAIRAAWSWLRDHAETRFVFHLEDDFTFNRPVPLGAMVRVLDGHPQLLQMALRRQPWNHAERQAGGVVELQPAAFADCTDGTAQWLEHRLFWTTNPSMYRTDVVREHGWPAGSRSEGRFTAGLLRSPTVRFGYWGARESGEWTTHIGEERVGVGY